MHILNVSKSYKKELKRQIKIGIVAAIGFTIAFVWRETVLKIMENASYNLANQLGIGNSPIYMPLLTTIIGVTLIFLFSKLLKDKS